jgi:hypothetical protein
MDERTPISSREKGEKMQKEINCDWHSPLIQRMIAMLPLRLLDDSCAATPASRIVWMKQTDHWDKRTRIKAKSGTLITVNCRKCYGYCWN